MSCARCGGDYKIESHHIVHKVNGGKDIPENMVDLCRHCHKYQHAKEKLLDALEYYLNDARNVFRSMNPKYIREHVELTLKRLEYLEQENTPLLIQERGYYPYWNNKNLHQSENYMKSCKSIKCLCFTCAKRSTSRCCPGKIAKPDCEGIKFCPDYRAKRILRIPLTSVGGVSRENGNESNGTE